jgi:hypothetical protein
VSPARRSGSERRDQNHRVARPGEISPFQVEQFKRDRRARAGRSDGRGRGRTKVLKLVRPLALRWAVIVVLLALRIGSGSRYTPADAACASLSDVRRAASVEGGGRCDRV